MAGPLFERDLGRPGPERILAAPVHDRDELCELLDRVIGNGVPFGGLSVAKLVELSKAVKKAESPSTSDRVQKLDKRKKQFSGRNSLAQWVGVRLMAVGVIRGEAYRKAEHLINFARLAAETPDAHIPEIPTRREVLSTKLLDQAAEWIALTKETEGSIANRLLDPIELAVNGLILAADPPKGEDSLCYDPTIPLALLDILESLRYKESGEVFQRWLTDKLTSATEAPPAEDFLFGLINFTTFLDSSSHREMWRPKKDVPGRQAEILRQPFRALLNSVENSRQKMYGVRGGNGLVGRLFQMEKLLLLRYGEVYRGTYQTSLYADSVGALVPTAEDFAQLALLAVERGLLDKKTPEVIADALVKTVEAVGLPDVQPLIRILGTQPEVRDAVVARCEKAGLIASKGQVERKLDEIRSNPWLDMGDEDMDLVFPCNTGKATIVLYTGTYGPGHKGHMGSAVGILSYFDFLTRKNGQDKPHQYQLLTVPAPDMSLVPQYKKDPAKMGPEEARIASLLLQLPRDPRVHITRDLQPSDALAAGSTAGRSFSIEHKVKGKISIDLERAGRVANFSVDVRFAFGADELGFTQDHPRKLAKEQTEKIMHPNGIVFGRRGYFLAILRNWNDIVKRTGVRTGLFTPSAAYASSSIVEEIAETGHTKAVDAAAEPLVVSYWNPQAVENRRRNPRPPRFTSVSKVNGWLEGYLEGLLTGSRSIYIPGPELSPRRGPSPVGGVFS